MSDEKVLMGNSQSLVSCEVAKNVSVRWNGITFEIDPGNNFSPWTYFFFFVLVG
jgi:hypothetical protein